MSADKADFNRKYITTLLSITVMFLFADQNLMAPNLTAIADYFHFDNRERDEKLGGDIAFGFFILGAPAAILVGYLADVMNRCILFGIIVIVGESACFATYWIETYDQLFVCRVLTGISIGGATPVIFSLLSDYYPGEARIYVSTAIGISMSTGIAGGQLLSGLVGSQGNWRLPFVLVATPAILLGLIVTFTATEPRRGSQEEAVKRMTERRHSIDESNYYQKNECKSSDNQEENDDLQRSSIHLSSDSDSNIESNQSIDYNEKINCSKVLVIFQTPSVILIFLQGIPGCIPWGLIYVFLNDYLSENIGMSVDAASLVLFMFAIGCIIGQVFGGVFGTYLYNIDKRLQCLLMGSTTALSVLPMLYLLNASKPGLTFYFMAFFTGCLVAINGPNVRSILQNTCRPEVRGTAFAVFTLTDDVGKGAGPMLIVLLLHYFNDDRKKTFNVAILFWLICGFLLFLLSFTVVLDEQNVQESITISLQQQEERQSDNQCKPRVEADSSFNPLTTPINNNNIFVPVSDNFIDSNNKKD